MHSGERVPKLSFVQLGPGILLLNEHLYTSPVWCWPFVSKGAPTNNLKKKENTIAFKDNKWFIQSLHGILFGILMYMSTLFYSTLPSLNRFSVSLKK